VLPPASVHVPPALAMFLLPCHLSNLGSVRQMSGCYLDSTTITSTQILTNSAFIYHPSARCCKVSILKASLD
jgi:hypothetical protein